MVHLGLGFLAGKEREGEKERGRNRGNKKAGSKTFTKSLAGVFIMPPTAETRSQEGMGGAVRAGGKRRRGAHPGHATLSGSGRDGEMGIAQRIDKSFLLGAAGLGTGGTPPARAPSCDPCGQRCTDPCLVQGTGQGAPIPSPGQDTDGTASPASPALRMGPIHSHLPPEPITGSWPGTIKPPPSHIRCSLLSYYPKHPPYGVAEVRFHSKKTRFTHGGMWEPARFLCMVSLGQDFDNIKENQ